MSGGKSRRRPKSKSSAKNPRAIPHELWPSQRYKSTAKDLSERLAAYEAIHGALEGIAKPSTREAFVCQVIESTRRVRYVAEMLNRSMGPACGDPSTNAFDPLKAAILSIRASDIEEAYWLAFIFVHFGKSSKSGWRLARDFYAGKGPQSRWTWKEVSKDPQKVVKWLAAQIPKWKKDGVKRSFGNHRKYESLDETGEVIESYVGWVKSKGTHVKLFKAAVAGSANARAAFDALYDSMDGVKQFGRTGRFDFLAMIGKLGLAAIEPASAYLGSATGPLDGAKQLFGPKRSRKLGPAAMENELLKLGDALGVNQQVLEDAICNWQKSPSTYKPFRG